MDKATTISIELTDEKIEKIKSFYAENIVPTRSEYVRFQVKIPDVSITVYHSEKAVFQGKKAKYEASIWSNENLNEIWKYNDDQIGSDEVGTGDYFGPMCVCAAYVRKEDIKWLDDLGINDSKKLDDKKILELVPKIIKKIPYSQMSIMPEKYNALVEAGYNQARIKTIIHNQVLYNLKKKIKRKEIFTVVDQFLVERTYYNYLKKGENVVKNICFETKADSKYPSVAVASMIARYSFLSKMKLLSKTLGATIPKGAGKEVDEFARKHLLKLGSENMKKFVKYHFSNTKRIMEEQLTLEEDK